ncbi:MAG: type II toxin-antitoxin system VapC family toxin [Planctomycetota bacterium]|nr:type II toxin-antitoxin system VapC family toxin [Planctomycetota bacterium]
MKRAVLDASVAIKLYFQEEHSEAAERCVRLIPEVLAPDLIWAEMGNVVWKRQRRGDLSGADAASVVRSFLTLPLQIHPASGLLADALELAVKFDRSVYDGLYLALALKTRSILISADKRFVNALKDTPAGKHLEWLGDSSAT